MDAVMSVLGKFEVNKPNNYHADACLAGGKVIWFRQYHPAVRGNLFRDQKRDFWFPQRRWQNILHKLWPPDASALDEKKS
jgi:hypothetical protein